MTTAIVPLAQENRRLHEKEVDEKILKPVVLGLVQILDRQAGELSEAEKGIGAIAFLEDCRRIDKAEIFNILAQFEIEEINCDVGNALDSTIHNIKAIRAARNRAQVNRIARVLRPGYRRRSDGWVARACWVEVWVSPTSKRQ